MNQKRTRTLKLICVFHPVSVLLCVVSVTQKYLGNLYADSPDSVHELLCHIFHFCFPKCPVW